MVLEALSVDSVTGRMTNLQLLTWTWKQTAVFVQAVMKGSYGIKLNRTGNITWGVRLTIVPAENQKSVVRIVSC